MATDWTMTISQQLYSLCCPCLFAKELCESIEGNEGNGMLGCLAGCFCPLCFRCYIAPKIAAKSGIEEDLGSAIMKTVCCCTSPCYGSSVALEHLKQKKLLALGDSTGGKGSWMVSIKDQYRAAFCPCLVGKDMFEHLGESGTVGCLARCFFGPCFFCYAGPKIAQLGSIEEDCSSAVLKMICPCTAPCYAGTVYAEYMFQAQLGLGAKAGGAPPQVEMQ